VSEVPAYTRDAIAAVEAAWHGQHDFAGWLAAVLTAVAARVGPAPEVLVVGRPGSWEAADVLHLVEGTAGSDAADLDRWRNWPAPAV
jgi:hypothetical protein